jgi:uncharacterized membrane protein YfcA
MNEILLVIISLITAIFTAIVGFGGGMILIAFMPGFIPASAIVPIHSVVQLLSNSSRALFSWRAIHWNFLISFIIGSIIGVVVAAQFINQINLDYIPLFIAAYILCNVWGPKLEFEKMPRGEFFTIGIIQTGLSLIISATGPLTQSTFQRMGLNHHSIVASSALSMSITHIIKIPVFALLGFSFIDYWRVILGMSLGVIIGTYLGTHVRYKISALVFRKAVDWLLTLLALRMVYITLPV